MEFRILGPLEVEEDGRSLAPGGRKARALLAVLLIHANEPVSADRLVDEVWGDELPENAAKSLQIHVSRLRKALGIERLRTVGAGYQLWVEPGELDRDRAAELVRRGRARLEAGDATAAASTFAEALALFRARPLEEFAGEHFAQAEIARLEELRLSAAEGRVDAELALGHGPRVVAELEALVEEDPLRERPREQLMVALYQAGRQADALAVYADTRRTFGEELGLEPGPGLRELERQILNHDPALGSRPSRVLQAARRGRARRPWIAAAATLAAAIAIGVSAWALDSDPTLPPRSLGVLDPATLELKRIGALAGAPTDVVIGRRAVFVGLPSRRSVVVIDPGTLATTMLGTAVRPARLTRGSQAIWLVDTRQRTLARLGSDRVYRIAYAPGRGTAAPIDAIAAGMRDLWLAERDAEIVFRFDAGAGTSSQVENRGADSFFEGGARRAIAVGAGSVWVTNPVSHFSGTDRFGRVSRIDLRTREVTARIRVPAPPIALAADSTAVWVGLDRGETLWRIDPHDEVAAAAVQVGPVVDLALGEGAVWALTSDGTVSRIDPRTNSVTGRVRLGRGTAIAAGHGAVWVGAP